MPARKLHRIGVLTCHPTHHHMPNIYGPLIQCVPMEEDYTPTRMTGMELTHIWDHDPQRVESFCAKFGTVPVERYDDMVDKVDGIMLTNLCAGDYFHLLAAPYLQAGIPVFFNRCFTPRLGKAREIIELSQKHGTPIIVASAWEYTDGAYALQEAVRQFGLSEIRGITAYNSSNEITHDVHGLWLVLAAAGGGIESVAVHRSITSIYEHGSDVWTVKFRQRDDHPVFYATIHNTVGFRRQCLNEDKFPQYGLRTGPAVGRDQGNPYAVLLHTSSLGLPAHYRGAGYGAIARPHLGENGGIPRRV